MLVFLEMIEDEEDYSKFEQLYKKYMGLMFYIAKKYLPNEQDREDAVQAAFESIAKNIKKISKVDCPQTYSYIVVITERKAIDILRGIQRNVKEEFDEKTVGVAAELTSDCGLADALAKLPAHYREILLLRYDCGFSTRELAAMLDMTRSNVQKQIWRAKEALAKQLREEANDEEHNR